MATLHELHAQIEQGKIAVLFFTGETELLIRKNVQGWYTYEIIEQKKKPITDCKSYHSWSHLLEDVSELLLLNDQWSLK